MYYRLPSSSLVDRGFEPKSGQSKDYYIGSCCFSAMHTAVGSKNKDWLVQNHDNMFRVERHVHRRLLFR